MRCEWGWRLLGKQAWVLEDAGKRIGLGLFSASGRSFGLGGLLLLRGRWDGTANGKSDLVMTPRMQGKCVGVIRGTVGSLAKPRKSACSND